MFQTAQHRWRIVNAPHLVALRGDHRRTGVGVLTQEEYRLRHQLPDEGFHDEDVTTALTLLHDQLDRVRAGEDPAAVHAAQAAWHGSAWFSLLAGTSPETIGALVEPLFLTDPTEAGIAVDPTAQQDIATGITTALGQFPRKLQ